MRAVTGSQTEINGYMRVSDDTSRMRSKKQAHNLKARYPWRMIQNTWVSSGMAQPSQRTAASE
jgi:hypothetical protein